MPIAHYKTAIWPQRHSTRNSSCKQHGEGKKQTQSWRLGTPLYSDTWLAICSLAPGLHFPFCKMTGFLLRITLEIKRAPTLEDWIHVVWLGEVKIPSYLCDCLMQAAGQPCIDLSWPVPDNLMPLSSLVNIHWGPAMDLITLGLVWSTDIFNVYVSGPL